MIKDEAELKMIEMELTRLLLGFYGRHDLSIVQFMYLLSRQIEGTAKTHLEVIGTPIIS